MTAPLLPSPALRAALDAYGRAYCRAAHLDTMSRRNGLAAAEQALLAVIASDEERALWEGVEAGREGAALDDGPRLHIPADLLTREGVRR